MPNLGKKTGERHMNKQLFLKTLQLWILFTPLAIINGSIRNYVYQPVLGDLAAHQLSTVLAVILFICVAYIFLGSTTKHATNTSLFLAGFGLLLITILFEFVFGHYVVGHPWSRLLADYNVQQGRVWSLFLITLFFTPFIVKQLKIHRSQ